MLARKTPHPPPTTVSSISSRSRSPTPGDWDADDELGGTMSGDDAASVRPITIQIPTKHSSGCPKRPTLKEILSNSSPPPWTLTAFMAYLSNNHCLETLEFTMDASRYRKHYAKVVSKSADKKLSPVSKEAVNVKMLWQRLIEAYIRPNGSREINIPSEVRDPILNLDYSVDPPAPEVLDVAVAKVYELMEDSVLVPFLNSMSPRNMNSPPPTGCECIDDEPMSPNPLSPRGDDKSSIRKSRFGRYSPPLQSPVKSPSIPIDIPAPCTPSRRPIKLSLTTALHRHRLSTKLSPTSSTSMGPLSASQTTSAGTEGFSAGPGLTDDSGYTSSHTNESILTPPMSPPECELPLSPISSRDSPSTAGGSWKKFGRLSQWKPMRKKPSQSLKLTESMP